MKTIYNAILKRLQPLLDNNRLRWIDWDKGQLKKSGNEERPQIAFPCALVRIAITGTTDITDIVQYCKSAVTITLAFDTLGYGRTAANAPEDVREQSLVPYDVIADVYAALQGYGTEHFDSLRRRSQGELTHNDLFVYQIVFDCEFEDNTANPMFFPDETFFVTENKGSPTFIVTEK